MRATFQRATQVASATLVFIGLAACGANPLKPVSKSSAPAQLAGGSLQDCWGLQQSAGSQLTDVVVVPPTGQEPVPPVQSPGQYDTSIPCQIPGQIPGQIPPQTPSQIPVVGANPYIPIGSGYDGSYGNPTQRPNYPGTCGVAGTYCDNGGIGQWPATTIHGVAYDRSVVQACFAAFHAAGWNTQGQWGIDFRNINNVSVLSSADVVDVGIDPRLVVINAVSVLGQVNFRLLDPNALYCVKAVSVLENVHVTSCHQGNVVFGSNVSVLSGQSLSVVGCN